MKILWICLSRILPKVDISLKFGVTELVVEAYNTATSMRVDSKLEYGFGDV